MKILVFCLTLLCIFFVAVGCGHVYVQPVVTPDEHIEGWVLAQVNFEAERFGILKFNEAFDPSLGIEDGWSCERTRFRWRCRIEQQPIVVVATDTGGKPVKRVTIGFDGGVGDPRRLCAVLSAIKEEGSRVLGDPDVEYGTLCESFEERMGVGECLAWIRKDLQLSFVIERDSHDLRNGALWGRMEALNSGKPLLCVPR